MDNDNLSEHEDTIRENQLNTPSKLRPRNRRPSRRIKKQNLESQLDFFRKSRQTEETEKEEKTYKKISLSQIIFLFFTITPLFFSLAIFLSKTVLKQQPQEITTTEQFESSSFNAEQNLIKKIPTEPKTPQLPNQSLDQKINSNSINQQNNQNIYSQNQNIKLPQNKNPQLEKIIADIINICKSSGLSTESISITLLDLNTRVMDGYQSEKLRYPASVVKIFWLVAALNNLPQASDQASMQVNIEKMIKQSDNDSSGYVVDWLTGTQSGEALSDNEFQKWAEKRRSLNTVFSSQYGNLDITHKTFPLPKQKFFKPEGRDLQLRGGNIDKPVRNKISTDQTTWLMYQIVTDPQFNRAKQLLTTDLVTFDWKDSNINYFNPVMGLFGESLPTNIEFVSKAGWTSQTRQEVAYIAIRDGKTKYILTIFAEDPAYSKDKTIFPKISKAVFEAMSNQ